MIILRQKKFANPMGAKLIDKKVIMGKTNPEVFSELQKLHEARNRARGISNNNQEAIEYVTRLRNARNGIGW